MPTLILRRLLAGLVVLWLVHLATFLALRAMPGDPWADLAGDRDLPPTAVARLQQLYGHDRPLVGQYLGSLGDVLRGDLGHSLKLARGQRVDHLLFQAAPASIAIGCGALLLGLALGLPAGVWAARRAHRRGDQVVRLAATVGISLPEFVVATVLLVVFSLWLGWLPAGGLTTPAGLVLPVVTLALPLAAALARLVRASLIAELAADFTRTARAKGATETRVVWDHALRPAFGPVLAWLATAAANVLTGAMVVELVFAIPGLGFYFVAGALEADWTVVSACALLYAALLVLFNLAADLALAWLDPRTR